MSFLMPQRLARMVCDAPARTRSDPTGTLTIRRTFAGEFDRRWRAVKMGVNKAVRDADSFAFSPGAASALVMSTQGGRIKAFQTWFDTLLATNILGDSLWLVPPLARGYEKGVSHAARPHAIDAGRIQLLVNAAAIEVQGVMETVSQQVLRVVNASILANLMPREVAFAVNKIIDDVGVLRSHAVASTTVVLAHATGTLDALESNGVRRVGIIPETQRRAVVTDAPRRINRAQQRVAERANRRLSRLSEVNVKTAEDDDVCPRCESIAEDGPYTINTARGLIPAHPRCILPGSEIQGNVIAALKSNYSGPVFKITTNSGRRLSITENHPVLTTNGWIAAKSLRQGMKLVSQRDHIKVNSSSINLDNDNGPAKIEEIFDTLSRNGFCSISPSGDDLHGDAFSINGKIDIVFADGRLLSYAQLQHPETIGQFGFALPNKRQVLVLHQSRRDQRSQRNFTASCGHMGSRTLSLHNILINFFRHSFSLHPLEFLRFGSTSGWDVMKSESIVENISAHTKFITQLLKRGSGEIVLDELIDIERFTYTGHVYDLQTTTGHMIANGVCISNCRCAFVAVDDDDEFEDAVTEDEFDPDKHPRHPAGTSEGGEFAPVGGGGETDMHSEAAKKSWAEAMQQIHEGELDEEFAWENHAEEFGFDPWSKGNDPEKIYPELYHGPGKVKLFDPGIGEIVDPSEHTVPHTGPYEGAAQRLAPLDDRTIRRALEVLHRRGAENLNEDEQRAITKYTSNDYVPINASLRGRDYFPYYTEEALARIKHLDSAMDKSSLPEDMVLYRRPGRNTSERLMAMNVGDQFIDKGFVSASASAGGTEEFSGNLIAVQVPRGTRGLPPARLSNVQEENEVIIDRNSTYEVVHRRQPGEVGPALVVRVVDQDRKQTYRNR